jgi:hypothetical protein
MIPPLDPFAQKFDAIEVDPARAPAREAIESAMSLAGPVEDLLTPSAAAPEFANAGFYLLDNAGGRFVVDREMGVVSLADEALLEHERGAVHGVRMRVVEQSGATYEVDMQLRITGAVPQMVGAEEFAAIAGLAEGVTLIAPRIPVLIVDTKENAPAASAPPIAEPVPIVIEAPVAAPASVQIPWTRFAVAQGHCAHTPRMQPRRGFIAAELPVTSLNVSLDFAGPPARFPAYLPWSL